MKLKTIIIIVAIIAGLVAVWYFLIRKRQEEAPALDSSTRADLIRGAAPIRGAREEVRTAPPRMATAEGGTRPAAKIR